MAREGEGYTDLSGFCKSVALVDIRTHGYTLTPGRFVGSEEMDDDIEPIDEKFARLTAILDIQFSESEKLASQIQENNKRLTFDI